MSYIYIDPSAEVDGDGSFASPWNTPYRKTYVPGNNYQIKRGTTATADSGMGINDAIYIDVDGTINNYIVVDSYGTADAQPILDGNLEPTAISGVRAVRGSYLRISDIEFKQWAGIGVEIKGSLYFELKNIYSHLNGDPTAVRPWSSGFGFVSGESLNPDWWIHSGLVKNCISDYNGHHGFMISKIAKNIVFQNCSAGHNGQLRGSHGFNSGQWFKQWTDWDLVSGTIYKHSYATLLFEPDRVVPIGMAYIDLTKNPGNYATLSDGEWDTFEGDVYININTNPNAQNVAVIVNQCNGHKLFDFEAHHTRNVEGEESFPHTRVSPGEGGGIGCDNFSQDVEVHRAYVHDNTGFGTMSNSGVDISIFDSVITGNACGFVGLLHSRNSLLYNNTLYDTAKGYQEPHSDRPDSLWAQGVNYRIYTDGNKTYNNIITDGDNEALTNSSIFSSLVDYNCFYNNSDDSGAGANGITSNPQMGNPGGGDFTLNSNSPCIGTGLSVSGYHDTQSIYTGDRRKIKVSPDGNVDMGAYQFETISFDWGDSGETDWDDVSDGWHLGAGASIIGGSLSFTAQGSTAWAVSPVINSGNWEGNIDVDDTEGVSGYAIEIRGSKASFAWDNTDIDWVSFSTAVDKDWKYHQVRLSYF